MKIVAALAAVCCLVGCTSAAPKQPSPTPPAPSATATPTSSSSTPAPPRSSAPERGGLDVRAFVANQDGAISVYVPVVIHGRRYAFLVDSGAAGTIIDSAAARRTKLRDVGPGTPLQTIGCTSPTTLSRVTRWTLGGRGLPDLVLTTKDIGFGSFRVGGLLVGGILGSDLLVRLGGIFTVDYGRKIVTFGGRVPHGRRVAVSVSPLSTGGAVVAARVSIGTTAVRMQIDTGASHSTLDDDLAQRLHLPAAGKVVNANAVGCGVRTQPVTLRGARLGNVALPRTVIVSVDTGSVSGNDIVGLVGGDLLAPFGAVTIDYEKRTLVLGG